MPTDAEPVEVRLLGSIDLVVAGRPRPVSGPRRKAVLATLALHRGRIVSTDRLLDVVWGHGSEGGRINTLQRHVSYLRQAIGGRNVIVSRPPGYLVDLPPGAIDAEQAEDLLRRAQRTADPAERARWAQETLRLFRGAPLVEVDDVPWLREEAQRLDGLRAQAVRTLTDGRLALGHHAELLPDLERLAAEHPLDEHVQGQLILALYRSGRQTDALDVYDRVRRTLGDEFGIDTGPELRRLTTAILRHEPDLQIQKPIDGTGTAAPTIRDEAALTVRDEAALTVRDEGMPAIGGGASPAIPDAGSPGIRDAGSRTVRGTGEPVTRDAPVPRLGGLPLLSRDRELALLRAAVDTPGGCVFVVGEPGIGKTRLTQEAASYARHRGLKVLRGRAALPSVPYRPLTEALQSALRRTGPPADERLLPYRAALARLVPQLREGGRDAVEDSPVILAEAVLRLVASLDENGTGVLLVLEDLHDADADTLAVVDCLADHADGERLLIIGTCRPGPGPAPLLIRGVQQRRACQVVEPARLPGPAVRDLAAACLDVVPADLPEPVLDRLLTSADGVPLHVEELLAGFVDDGTLRWTGDRWEAAAPVASAVPASIAETLAARVDRLSPETRTVLRAGALFGRQFPALAAGAAAGVEGPELLDHLREAVAHQLVAAQEDPGWYAFRHTLTAEALRVHMLPVERTGLARRAAHFLAAPHKEFTGSDQLLAELWNAAREPERAAGRFGAAGRQAAAQGAVASAIVLLERALSLVDRDLSGELAADLGEALLGAYAAAGRVSDAYTLGNRLAGGVVASRRSSLHLHLAGVATAAGDWEQARRSIGEARRYAGTNPDPALTARLDAADAQLTVADPDIPDRLGRARQLAGRALRASVAAGRPETSCVALETLGRCARVHDLAEADALYERGLTVATAHDLVGWRMNFLFQLGADEGIRDGDPRRLTEALDLARQAGAVVTALDIELELSVVRLCRGEGTVAEQGARGCERDAARLRLGVNRMQAVGVRVMAAGHLGRRADMESLLVTFRELGGEQDDLASAVHGFGVAFCHLVHGDTAGALAELELAAELEARRPAAYVSLIHGPRLLLTVLAERAGWAECAKIAASAQAQARWNSQFVPLAEAVLHRREGQYADAAAAVTRFLDLSRPYPLARRLGLRLAGPFPLIGDHA